MSARGKTFAVVAAIAALAVAFRGTAQALPTTDPIPNYNFQSWDEFTGGTYPGSPAPGTPPTSTYGSVPDGQESPYNNATSDYGVASNWFIPLDSRQPAFQVWNPSSNLSLPVSTNTTGPVNVVGLGFSYSDGNGSLPGTAAGSQCLLDTSTALPPGNDQNYTFLINGNATDDYGAGLTTLQQNKRYTFTTAVASPLGATYVYGGPLFFYQPIPQTPGEGNYSENETVYPKGATSMTSFVANGIFQDVSYSLSSAEMLSAGWTSGNSLGVGFGAGPGSAWSNARLIEQNWLPMYSSAGGSGTVAWGGATSWSNTSAFSGGSLNTTWVNGMDAVFEPWQDGGGNWQGGTVTVSSNVTSVNSINFNTSWLTGNYTITSGNGSTITLTGDAIINVGAGTNGIDLMQGDQDSNPGYVGGGTATIACTLAGTSGMYKAGAGTLILTGSNTYLNNADHTKDTIIGGGTLQIGNGGTTGDLAGNVSNSANMAFYRTDSSGYVFGGTISGTGSVDILGGKTIFTANHSYTGLTTINGGATLQLGNNTSTGSIVGDVVDNGTLAFNRSDTLTYAGKIYGTGGVTQAGSGTTVLSGSNTY